MEPIAGLVLAGGKSTRFGSDKAAAVVAGKPMLQWVLEALARVCAELVVVRARGQTLPPIAAFSPTIVDDEYEEMGPLAGLVSGFGAVESPLCFAASCDIPLLMPALVTWLAARADNHDIVCPIVESRLQPLVAVYRPAACLAVFRDFVARGNLKVTAAFGRLRLDPVPEVMVRTIDPELRSFRNANRPQDAGAIEALLAAPGERGTDTRGLG